jgi:hypothetical protein
MAETLRRDLTQHYGNFTGPPPEGAYTIDEFCAAFKLSRSMFYKLAREGRGPVMMDAGKPLVSYSAAAQWRREREAANTLPESQKISAA